MNYTDSCQKIIEQVLKIAQNNNKLSGFCIGCTRKPEKNGLYFAPIRNTYRLVSGSVIVYTPLEAANIARIVDRKVQYILIDIEKKINREGRCHQLTDSIEQAVRETVKYSTILTYKGNDLAVDSVDCLVGRFLEEGRLRRRKKVAIIGAGNVGTKLALKLVERNIDVVITRRNKNKLETIVQALNFIKAGGTTAEVKGTLDNEAAAYHADILIGLTNGIPVIEETMITNLAEGSLIIDGGKGCFSSAAIYKAKEMGLMFFRADIRPGFEGYISTILGTEQIIENTVGRCTVDDITIVSGGLFAYANEIVVDNVYEPTTIYGMADGQGDFVRTLSSIQKEMIDTIQKYINECRFRSIA